MRRSGRARAILERGRYRARYRKAHLLDRERAIFEAGRESVVFDVDGVAVGVCICYDLQSPEVVAAAAAAGARVLACPCNNMLQRETAEKWKLLHNELRCARAREARVWIAASDVIGERAGRVAFGSTAIIGSSGVMVAQVPFSEESVVVAEVGDGAAQTPSFD